MPVPQTHLWISIWFFVSSLVVFWDAGYCLMRPRSMEGGDLNWIWSPYNIYAKIDYIYGLPALEAKEGFTNAQSTLNLVENVVNLAYLYKAHISPSPIAPLIGFAGVTMTLSKTILYWLQEYFCDFCKVGHNTASDLILFWLIPNGPWVVLPTIIMYVLGKDIATSLSTQRKLENVSKMD